LKAWQRGWQSIYTPDTFCYHDHSVTIKTKFKQFFVKKTINRNKLFLQSVYLNGISLLLFFCLLFLKFIYSVLFFFLPKRKAFILAFFELLAMRKDLIFRRKMIKETSVNSLSDLTQTIGSPAN
jgi:GT2 family glycosyltransferase